MSGDYRNQPHIFLQWKGTDVCMDIDCTCGWNGHFDGYFAYAWRCPVCKTVWRMPDNPVPYLDPKYDGVIVDPWTDDDVIRQAGVDPSTSQTEQ